MGSASVAQAAGTTKLSDVWHAVLIGEPVSKANSRRVVTTGRKRFAKTRVIKSAKALAWAASVERQLLAIRFPPLFAGPVCVRATLYYRSERPDLDESLLLDLLQGHAYQNDRQVRAKIITHAIDRANPRVDVTVWRYVAGSIA